MAATDGDQALDDRVRGGAGLRRQMLHPVAFPAGRRAYRYSLLVGWFMALVLGCFLAGFLLAPWLGMDRLTGFKPKDVMLAQPVRLQPFRLVDHDGNAFTHERLQGRWTLMFFGYNHCPDHCPQSLGVLRDVVQRARSDPWTEHEPQVVFVTVDSRRDSPTALRRWLSRFDASFVGLRGNDRATVELAQQLGVLFLRNPPDEQGRYFVDHPATVLLINPDAVLIAGFNRPRDAPAMAERLAEIARNYDSRPGSR